MQLQGMAAPGILGCHVICALKNKGIDIENYIHKFYMKSMFIEVYSYGL